MTQFREIAKILIREGEQIESILQQELIAQDHIASGKLYDSFDVDFDVKGNSLVLNITNSAGYAIAVDEGSKPGTKVGLIKLIRWVKQKQRRGKMLPFDNQSALVIANRVRKSIRKKGTVSPRGFIGNALETAEKVGVFDRIKKATGLQVDAILGQTEVDETITVMITV
tara:strand:- start:8450 stop:8956 length:507 start_codon:yes stop_codon:yes gene_type:complete